jgi:hypothetical protein
MICAVFSKTVKKEKIIYKRAKKPKVNIDLCLRRVRTFLKKGSDTSKNFLLRGLFSPIFFACLRVSSRFLKIVSGFKNHKFIDKFFKKKYNIFGEMREDSHEIE